MSFLMQQGAHKGPQLQRLRVNRSSYGDVIPIIYGTQRISTTVLQTNDFRAIQDTPGKFAPGGKAAPTFYRYTVTVELGLCQGPISNIARSWTSGGAGTNNIKRDINYTRKNWTLFKGNWGQAPWQYLVSNHFEEAYGYTGVAYVARQNWNLGGSAQLPQKSFEVQGKLVNTPTSNTFLVGVGDCLINSAAYDLLTAPQYGAQFPDFLVGRERPTQSGSIDPFADWDTYCQCQGLYFSPILDKQRSLAEWFKEFAEMSNSEVCFISEALYFIPYAEQPITGPAFDFPAFGYVTYTPQPSQWDFTEKDFLTTKGQPPVTVERKISADRYNQVIVDYNNRMREYNSDIAIANEEALSNLFAVRPKLNLHYPHICRPNVAQAVAQLRLQKEAYNANTYKWKAPQRFIQLDPMDFVTLTDAGIGLNKKKVRITEIEEDAKGVLSFTAVDPFPGTIQTPSLSFPTQTGTGNSGVDGGAAVDDINTPVFFEPYGSMTGGKLQIWMAVSSPSTNYGGAGVWFSEDGSTYRHVGAVNGNAAMGFLMTSLPATADPDTTDTLQVDLTESLGVVTSISHSQADADYNLAFVDNEFISFATVSPLLGEFQYGLTYLRRGQFGSPVISHNAGTNFALIGALNALAPGIFAYTYPSRLIGKVVFFKFTTFTILGSNEEDVSQVPAYAYTINGNGLLQNASTLSLTGQFSGTFPASQVLVQLSMPGKDTIPSNFSGSSATLQVAPTGTLIINVLRNGTNIGSITFSAGSTTGTWSGGNVVTAANDKITFVAPVAPDATAAGFSVTLLVVQTS